MLFTSLVNLCTSTEGVCTVSQYENIKIPYPATIQSVLTILQCMYILYYIVCIYYITVYVYTILQCMYILYYSVCIYYITAYVYTILQRMYILYHYVHIYYITVYTYTILQCMYILYITVYTYTILLCIHILYILYKPWYGRQLSSSFHTPSAYSWHLYTWRHEPTSQYTCNRNQHVQHSLQLNHFQQMLL